MSDGQETLKSAVRSGGETLDRFLERLASSAPTPGGGAVAALVGALAAALAHMVASLTVGKKKFADVEPEFRAVMPGLLSAIDRLKKLMDDDATAFDGVMAAMKLPKTTPDEIAARTRATETAALLATNVPMQTLIAIGDLLPAVRLAAQKGYPHAVSDAGMAALLIVAGARAAAMNVKINLSMLPPAKAAEISSELRTRLAIVPEAAKIAAEVDDRL